MLNAKFINLSKIESDLSTLLTKEEYRLNDYILFDFILNQKLYVLGGMVISKDRVADQNLYAVDVVEISEELRKLLENYGADSGYMRVN
ncbi:MAG: hypothetical protein JW702_01065 [Clostridiales bacterium]|nr:hypothetical protein [Clostridiales bacterium]